MSVVDDTVVPTNTSERVSLVTAVGPAVGQCDLCHVILALAPIAPCMPLCREWGRYDVVVREGARSEHQRDFHMLGITPETLVAQRFTGG